MVLVSCNGDTRSTVTADSVPNKVPTKPVPALDISGVVEALFIHAGGDVTDENGMQVLTVADLKEDDQLNIDYKATHTCEECHVEIQIWKNDKYVEVVRDTGFGTGKITIPASLFLECSKFSTPEYERLALYMSVRQYHPVETGNKRFLFYLDLK
jgi:hypothetical protein